MGLTRSARKQKEKNLQKVADNISKKYRIDSPKGTTGLFKKNKLWSEWGRFSELKKI